MSAPLLPQANRCTVRRIGGRCLGVLAMLVLLGGRPAAAENGPRIVIIREQLPPYEHASQGAVAAMREAGLQPRVREVVLDRQHPATPQTVEQVLIYKPAVVLAVGSTATRLSKQAFPNIPVVFAMVLNPVQSGIVQNVDAPEGHVTGAALDIPFELQFRMFLQVAPQTQSLGVLSNPKETGLVVQEAQRAAEAQGITLIVEQVSTNADVPAALERLIRRNIDGMWSVADSTVFSGSTPELIMKEAARAGLPTMGLSRLYCKGGFLFALSVDFEQNGRQAGELAVRIVNGAPPRSLPIALPRDVELYINLRIARYIGHEFPAGVLESAKEVFR